MVYTGLRISDVGLFHMDRLKGNEVFLRAKKNGGDVFAFIPDWLRDRLNNRAKRCGVRPFLVGPSHLRANSSAARRPCGGCGGPSRRRRKDRARALFALGSRKTGTSDEDSQG